MNSDFGINIYDSNSVSFMHKYIWVKSHKAYINIVKYYNVGVNKWINTTIRLDIIVAFQLWNA